MKKTFISPVAEFVATEAAEVIATSSFNNPGDSQTITGNGSGDEGKVVSDARTSNVSGAPAINVEALDF